MPEQVKRGIVCQALFLLAQSSDCVWDPVLRHNSSLIKGRDYPAAPAMVGCERVGRGGEKERRRRKKRSINSHFKGKQSY